MDGFHFVVFIDLEFHRIRMFDRCLIVETDLARHWFQRFLNDHIGQVAFAGKGEGTEQRHFHFWASG